MTKNTLLPLKCPECSREIRQPVLMCPHCGTPYHAKKKLRLWLSNRFRKLFFKCPGNRKEPGIFQAEVIIWWSWLVLPVIIVVAIALLLPLMKKGLGTFALPLLALRLVFLGLVILVIIILAFAIKKILKRNE